jgi:predicted DNA-binding antitoxin AbrB/MazE fold protein
MSHIVLAVYEQGSLHPLEPLPLRDHQKVRIQVLSEVTISNNEKRLNTWIEKGLLTPASGYSSIKPVSLAKRYQLADRLGKAAQKPLSEIIIEERGDW